MGSEPNYRTLSAGRVAAVTGALLLILLLVAVTALVSGTADISLRQLWQAITGAGAGDTATMILLKIRLPRILLAGVVGFALSLGGTVFQALLRNPLADPFILGVSSGSALGAIAAILMGFSYVLGIPLMAFGGAIVTVGLVLSLSMQRSRTESATILLTGVIVNAFFTAVIMFFVTTTTDNRLHSIIFWLYGDLSQSHFSQSLILLPVIGGAALWLYAYARELNLITVGEETAEHLGVDVVRLRMGCLLLVSLVVGLVVSFSGLIGFVGLIVPHLGRMAFGSDHRLLIPVSALGGAILLIIADTLARCLMSPSELPVGVITAFAGAPFFMLLLRKRGSRWSHF